MHIASACVGSKKVSDHFRSYVHSPSIHFWKRLFSGLEPMTTWSRVPTNMKFINYGKLNRSTLRSFFPKGALHKHIYS
jgi:hypothetical protein